MQDRVAFAIHGIFCPIIPHYHQNILSIWLPLSTQDATEHYHPFLSWLRGFCWQFIVKKKWKRYHKMQKWVTKLMIESICDRLVTKWDSKDVYMVAHIAQQIKGMSFSFFGNHLAWKTGLLGGFEVKCWKYKRFPANLHIWDSADHFRV